MLSVLFMMAMERHIASYHSINADHRQTWCKSCPLGIYNDFFSTYEINSHIVYEAEYHTTSIWPTAAQTTHPIQPNKLHRPLSTRSTVTQTTQSYRRGEYSSQRPDVTPTTHYTTVCTPHHTDYSFFVNQRPLTAHLETTTVLDFLPWFFAMIFCHNFFFYIYYYSPV